jgi:hypothetical protein
MPKDPKRNIQSYQLRGGHLNEFEYQKSQAELAEDSELPFSEEAGKPNPEKSRNERDEASRPLGAERVMPPAKGRLRR